MLSPPHHHHIVARCNALNLISYLVREPLLQLQAVGILVGTFEPARVMVVLCELNCYVIWRATGQVQSVSDWSECTNVCT